MGAKVSEDIRKGKEDLRSMYDHIDSLVTGVTVYRNGTTVTNRISVPTQGNNWGHRGAITYLTPKARARMLFVAMATSVEFRSMICLTYPIEFPNDGKKVKQHLQDWKQVFLRRYAGSYFWFLEFQKRGAPHIHFLSTRSNVFGADRRWLAESWAKAIGLSAERKFCDLFDRRTKCLRLLSLRVHSHPAQWQTIRDNKGARRYVAKYATKPRQKAVPLRYQNVGRFYGYSSDVKQRIEALDNFSIDADTIRNILSSEGHRASEWDFLPKYLFGVNSLSELGDIDL